jgi:feruloyl esterase
MIPGMQHCFGGTGATRFGQFGAPSPTAGPEDNVAMAMQQWVEAGRAPDSLIGRMGMNSFAAPADGDKQRLHCAWPLRAQLTPGSDPDKATSYTCDATPSSETR